MPNHLIAPSILSADFANLGEEAQKMEQAGADWLHVDVMDGHFVPNITIGPVVVKSLKKRTSLPLDTHLMISDPLKYAESFAKAGSWGLTFHFEAVRHPEVVIKEINDLGMKPAMSIKPNTPAELAFPYLKDLHHILIMTVEPGFGGQSFMDDMIPKISAIADYKRKNNLPCLIEVDGGVDLNTGKLCLAAGAEVMVAGSSIFKAADPAGMVKQLKAL